MFIGIGYFADGLVVGRHQRVPIERRDLMIDEQRRLKVACDGIVGAHQRTNVHAVARTLCTFYLGVQCDESGSAVFGDRFGQPGFIETAPTEKGFVFVIEAKLEFEIPQACVAVDFRFGREQLGERVAIVLHKVGATALHLDDDFFGELHQHVLLERIFRIFHGPR